MPKIRFEDLLRHFSGDITQVIGAESGRRRERREQEREEKKETNAEKLRMRLLERDHARDARADERAEGAEARAVAADRRAEEANRRAAEDQLRQRKGEAHDQKNPWVYQGMRFPTEAARNAARTQDVRTSAEIAAANRAPPRETAERPESHSRVTTSARGDVARWYSKSPDMTPSLAEKYLRELYPGKLSAGEISNIVEDVRAQYQSGSRRPRK